MIVGRTHLQDFRIDREIPRGMLAAASARYGRLVPRGMGSATILRQKPVGT